MLSQIFSTRKTNATLIEVDVVNMLLELNDFTLYYDYMKDLKELTTNKNSIFELESLCNDKKGYKKYYRRYKSFINKHHSVIELMQKYGLVKQFVSAKVNTENKFIESDSLSKTVNYLENNYEAKETIKEVIDKINELGLKKIYLWEQVDFSAEDYQLNFKATGMDYIYLENMSVIPTYDPLQIKYHSNDSMYALYLVERRNMIEPAQIIVKSLVIDPKRIPNKARIENSLNEIRTLEEERKADYQKVNLVVNAHTYAKELLKKFYEYERLLTTLEDSELKDEYTRIFNDLKKSMDELGKANTTLDDVIIKNSNGLDRELIENEKNGVMKRKGLIKD